MYGTTGSVGSAYVSMSGNGGNAPLSSNNTTQASVDALAASIKNHNDCQDSIGDIIDPDKGGFFASVTVISNTAARLGVGIACEGSRIVGEHLVSTGLMLNGSICEAFLDVVNKSLENGADAKLLWDGTSDVYKLDTICNKFRSVLQSVNDLQKKSAKSFFEHEKVFGKNVSSAYSWALIPWASGLLMLTAVEALYHGVVTGSLSTAAFSEFEPFCKEACQLISQTIQEGISESQNSLDKMNEFVKDQTDFKENARLKKPSVQTSIGNDKSRHATHATYAAALFSLPIAISKFVTLLEIRSLEGSTLASKKSSELFQKHAEEEMHPDANDWPEPHPLNKLSSFFNTLRELSFVLCDQKAEVENDGNGRKKSIALSAFKTSGAAACTAVLLSELLVLRSTFARLTELPKTANDTKEFSKFIVNGIDLRDTLSKNNSKEGTSNTQNTEANSNRAVEQAEKQTRSEEGKKIDFSLVSQNSELRPTGKSLASTTKSGLYTLLTTEKTNNCVTQTLHATFEKIITAPLHLTTEPLKEMLRLVRQVSQKQDNPQYATFSNDSSVLSAQIEELQTLLLSHLKEKDGVQSTYSATSGLLLEPIILASMSTRTLSQLCQQFNAIKDSLKECIDALGAESSLQLEETGARTNVGEKEISNPTETLFQSSANTLEVLQKQVEESDKNSDANLLMRHEQTLLKVEKGISLAFLQISKVLSLLLMNSGNLLLQVDHFKQQALLGSFELGKESEEALSKVIKDPETLAKHKECGGFSASTNITWLASATFSEILLKLFGTVNLMNSLVSEALLQALITATHPLDQTLSAIRTWENRVLIQESHPVEGESESVSTMVQKELTTKTATIARNILFSMCIVSGSSEQEEIRNIPAPHALQQIYFAFGGEERSKEKNESIEIVEIMDKMRELHLKREEKIHDEIKSVLKNKIGRRAITEEDLVAMNFTKAWVAKLQGRNEINSIPNFEKFLEDYLLDLIESADRRRFSGTGSRRGLTIGEKKQLRDLIIASNSNRNEAEPNRAGSR